VAFSNNKTKEKAETKGLILKVISINGEIKIERYVMVVVHLRSTIFTVSSVNTMPKVKMEKVWVQENN